MCLEFLDKFKNAGFALLRLGIGGMFVWHGYGKIIGGPDLWEKIGSAVSFLGISSGYQIFGFMATLSEFLGGICFILGLAFRPACFFLFFTMFVAAYMHLSKGDGLGTASHAIELGIVFLSFLFIGPGPGSLDSKFKGKTTK